MYRRNVVQPIYFGLTSLTDGTDVSNAIVTAYVTKDTGSQQVGGGTVTSIGNGDYRYMPLQAELDASKIRFKFKATGCSSAEVTISTVSFDPTNTVNLGVDALPPHAAGTSLGLPLGNSAGQVDVGSINGDPVAAANLAVGAAALLVGQVQSGSNQSQIVVNLPVGVVNLVGRVITFVTGQQRGATDKISSYSTGTIYLVNGLEGNPGVGDIFQIS